MIRLSYNLHKGQRDLILLALAELSMERPGLNVAIIEIVKEFGGMPEFDRFKALNRDRVREARDPIGGF